MPLKKRSDAVQHLGRIAQLNARAVGRRMGHLVVEIPDERVLTADERGLVRWLLDHAARESSSYLAQLGQLRVCSRCGCGCASVNFRIGDRGWATKGGMKVLSDHDWVGPDGSQYGIFLFEHDGTLAGIDVYAQNAPTVPHRLPTLTELNVAHEKARGAAQSGVEPDGPSARGSGPRR